MQNINLASSAKRSYHPLVMFYFYAGLLNKEQLSQIPKTTLDYWRVQNHTTLFGYEWVSTFCSDYADFNALQKRKIIFKSVRLGLRLLNTVSILLQNMKGFQRIIRNNAGVVIRTIDYLASEIRLDQVCRIFRITTQKFYRMKNKLFCSASVLNLCFKTHPQQLTIAECSTIKESVNATENTRKKLVTIWYKLMRQGKLYCSLSAFYKYTRLIDERIKRKKTAPLKLQIHCTRIFEFIHVDTTFLPTIQDGSVRAVIIKDNYSEKVLHQAVVENGDSIWVSLLLQDLFAKYDLYHYNQVLTLVSDGGSENKGDVITWLNNLENTFVCKKTARSENFAFTNNEIESTFNIFKNEFLANIEIHDKEHASRLLNEFQYYNDNERYPLALYGLTPQEVFDGGVIDKHRFRSEIVQTAKERYLKNKSGRFCDICSG